VGARFDGHPWTQEVDLEVVEPDHPATRHLDATWRWHDEVYQFRDLRPDARVLLRAPDTALDLDAPGAKRPPFGFPLAWCFEEGAGRVSSTSLGHFPGAWESPAYLRHLAGSLTWALG
jgi:type 1 glutamine amidotransferase